MPNLSVSSFFSLEEYAHSALFEGCSYPWEALKHLIPYLERYPLGKIEGEVSPAAYLINASSISIGKGTRVEPGAYIEGPCVIGENCVVRHGAYLRGSVITGDRCVLGHDTEIKHSILLNDVCAAHFNYVGDSILGNQVNLGAGMKCANLRLDHKLIKIFVEGKKVETGLKKIGVIAGDRAQFGCNSVANPGTLFGKGALCYPCISIQGFIAPNSIIKEHKV